MSKKILSVDDSVSIRQMVSFTLSEAGFQVDVAKDGIEALEKAKADKYDLFLTDLNMPNMDGITLIKKLRSDPKYKFTPILMLTTESQETKKMEGKAAGATGWIVKPFTPEQLIAVIKKVLP
ncbi:MAG TPA: response regulator [Ignavibacteriales bacterium]|nr:response regulator [Ignavibacteriales bacterium]HPD68421.1 response regulator [Ignavibacteriales bacterium]HRR17929.1 response regulator [Ignavibacteriales bacterium]HRT98840.1 response regulator [Ignavibacteriales bacterium]